MDPPGAVPVVAVLWLLPLLFFLLEPEHVAFANLPLVRFVCSDTLSMMLLWLARVLRYFTDGNNDNDYEERLGDTGGSDNADGFADEAGGDSGNNDDDIDDHTGGDDVASFHLCDRSEVPDHDGADDHIRVTYAAKPVRGSCRYLFRPAGLSAMGCLLATPSMEPGATSFASCIIALATLIAILYGWHSRSCCRRGSCIAACVVAMPSGVVAALLVSALALVWPSFPADEEGFSLSQPRRRRRRRIIRSEDEKEGSLTISATQLSTAAGDVRGVFENPSKTFCHLNAALQLIFSAPRFVRGIRAHEEVVDAERADDVWTLLKESELQSWKADSRVNLAQSWTPWLEAHVGPVHLQQDAVDDLMQIVACPPSPGMVAEWAGLT